MSSTDELWDEQIRLVDEIFQTDDPHFINQLMRKFAETTLSFPDFYDLNYYTKHQIQHIVFRAFLELSHIADEFAVPGVHVLPNSVEVAKIFNLFEPLKRYCQEMYLDDGIIGMLKYGETLKVGGDIILPALDLCSSQNRTSPYG